MNLFSKFAEISKRTERYLHRYGAFVGAYTFARAVCARGPVWLPLPGLEGQILLRRHTSDVAAFEQVFIDREYDLPIGDRRPKFIIDGGANVGCASVFFSRKFPQASIWAFEPERSNYDI